MAHRVGVVKWKKIAVSLYSGALDNYGTFKTTDDIINYLYNYQTTHNPVCDHELSDFYYHPERLECPIKLDLIFKTQSSHCVLCDSLSIRLTDDRMFKYSSKRNNVSASYPVSTLQQLEHLAVFHTPYFLLLFAELAENKRCVLYNDKDHRHHITQEVYDTLKSNNGSFDMDLDVTFLKLWWRYQDRRSRRMLNISIPWYIELRSELGGTWNPKCDSFADRKPEPLHGFIQKCLSYDIWESDCFVTPKTPCVAMCNTGVRSKSYAVQVKIPKLHSEAHLNSLITTYRQPALYETSREASVHPKLDCVALEDMGPNAMTVVLHVIVTLDSQWTPLEEWLQHSNPSDNYSKEKVIVGVLGALRSMCLGNKRPPRELYSNKENIKGNLAKVFFVHKETKDVLSLLPYFSINRMCRSRNTPQEENEFRVSCSNLILGLYNNHQPQAEADMQVVSELTDSELQACAWAELCMKGLAGEWVSFNVYGPRGTVNVSTDRWVDPECSKMDIVSKLNSMFTSPLHVTVLVPGYGETTVPETLKTLVDSLTITTLAQLELPWKPLDLTYRPGTSARKRTAEVTDSQTNVDRSNKINISTDLHLTTNTYRFTPCASSQASIDSLLTGIPAYSTTAFTPCINTETLALMLPDNNVQDISSPVEEGGGGWPVPPENPGHQGSMVEQAGGEWPVQVGQENTGHQVSMVEQGGSELSIDQEDPAPEPDLFSTLTFTPCINSEILALLMPCNTVQNITLVEQGVGEWPVQECQENTGHQGSVVEQGGSELSIDQEDPAPEPEFSTPTFTPCINSEILALMPGNRVQDISSLVEQSVGKWPVQECPENTGNDHQGGDVVTDGETDTGANAVQGGDVVTDGETDTGANAVRCLDSRMAIGTLLANMPRWRSNGIQERHLTNVAWTRYKQMMYITPVPSDTTSDITLQGVTRLGVPVEQMSLGLSETPIVMKGDRVPDDRLISIDPCDNKQNWWLGVESQKAVKNKMLKRPTFLKAYKCTTTSQTISCKSQPQQYTAVDLSSQPAPAKSMFKHVALHVNQLPISQGVPCKHLLRIKSDGAHFLGTLATFSGGGVLVRKLFANEDMMEDILDMHTRLQVHPFVSRVLTLQYMSVPQPPTDDLQISHTVGMFVGESAGRWNLGCPKGLHFTQEDDLHKLCYHVTKCLLLAQTVVTETLGHPLSMVQPARIWRCEDGFKLDFLSCLVDTFQHSDTKPSIVDGLKAIMRTLQRLTLYNSLPQSIMDNLSAINVDEGVFRVMYNILTLQEVRDVTLKDLLGNSVYQPFRLDTPVLQTEPFGPFRLQIQNQALNWNKCIIVEPVTDKPRIMAKISRKQVEKKSAVANQVSTEDSQESDEASIGHPVRRVRGAEKVRRTRVSLGGTRGVI